MIYLLESDYPNKILDTFSMNDSKPSVIPLGGHLELSREGCPRNEEEKKDMSKVPFDAAVSSAMHLMMCTRPDLAFSISVLSRYLFNPTKNIG